MKSVTMSRPKSGSKKSFSFSNSDMLLMSLVIQLVLILTDGAHSCGASKGYFKNGEVEQMVLENEICQHVWDSVNDFPMFSKPMEDIILPHDLTTLKMKHPQKEIQYLLDDNTKISYTYKEYLSGFDDYTKRIDCGKEDCENSNCLKHQVARNQIDTIVFVDGDNVRNLIGHNDFVQHIQELKNIFWFILIGECSLYRKHFGDNWDTLKQMPNVHFDVVKQKHYTVSGQKCTVREAVDNKLRLLSIWLARGNGSPFRKDKKLAAKIQRWVILSSDNELTFNGEWLISKSWIEPLYVSLTRSLIPCSTKLKNARSRKSWCYNCRCYGRASPFCFVDEHESACTPDNLVFIRPFDYAKMNFLQNEGDDSSEKETLIKLIPWLLKEIQEKQTFAQMVPNFSRSTSPSRSGSTSSNGSSTSTSGRTTPTTPGSLNGSAGGFHHADC